MCCCLTFAAESDRVPFRCGITPIPTPSQGRAGASERRRAERFLLVAQRALGLALTGVGQSDGPHGRRVGIPWPMRDAITVHDLYTLPY